MDSYRSSLSTLGNRSEIVRLYNVEGWTMKEVMLEMKRRHLESEPESEPSLS